MKSILNISKLSQAEKDEAAELYGTSDPANLRLYNFNDALMTKTGKKCCFYVGVGIMKELTGQTVEMPVKIGFREFAAYSELWTLMRAGLTAFKPKDYRATFEFAWPLKSNTKKLFLLDEVDEGETYAITLCFNDEN